MAEKKLSQEKTTWQSVKDFIPYYKPYKGIFLFDLFCVVLATASELVFPRMVGIITGEYLPSGNFTPILWIGLLLIIFKLVEVLSKYFITKYGHIMGAKIERDLRSNLFRHLTTMPHRYFDNVKVGSLMSRLTTDLFDITEFSHHCPEEFFVAGLKILGSLVILLVFHTQYWMLTLCLFVMLPVMMIFGVKYNVKMRTIFKQSRAQMAEINAQAEDTLGGIRVVKSFNNEYIEQRKFDKGNEKFLSIKKRNYHFMAFFQGGMRFFEALIYVTIVIFGSYLKLDASVFIEYLLYATTLITSVRMVAEYAEQFQQGITAFERYQDIIDTPPILENKPNAKELENVKGEIELNNITFKYAQDSANVLSNIKIKVHQGETVAIVGPSGSGKSTIANLIPRFYDISDGTITIDGNDIRDLTMESLRKNIGMVQQDVFMFWGTIAENIEYGKIGATFEEIKRAAVMAGANEFIEKMPNGYNSYVGERGVKLSGGQKQRISIARVFLKNPPILILDEATSSLDNESEMLVQESLDKLAHGRTAIVIAHRLSTIRNANNIIVLTENGVIESGSHAQLIEKGGLYKKLYDLSISIGRLN
ncbi:MAG: ABC transporter ATP-binding protein [Clostridia bacterium]